MVEKNRRGQDQMLDNDVLGRIEEAIKQTRRGVLSPNDWQAFVEHRNPFENDPVDMVERFFKDVRRILGETRVFTAQQVAEALNPYRIRVGLPALVVLTESQIPNLVAEPNLSLRDILRENLSEIREFKRDLADIRHKGRVFFAYSYGIPLRELYQMFWRWPFDNDGDTWVNEWGEAHYHLMGIGRCGWKASDRPNDEISGMGSEYYRSFSDNAQLNIILTNWAINGEWHEVVNVPNPMVMQLS